MIVRIPIMREAHRQALDAHRREERELLDRALVEMDRPRFYSGERRKEP